MLASLTEGHSVIADGGLPNLGGVECGCSWLMIHFPGEVSMALCGETERL